MPTSELTTFDRILIDHLRRPGTHGRAHPENLKIAVPAGSEPRREDVGSGQQQQQAAAGGPKAEPA